jgi:glycosyltransferase involved in cell wall biosynthesis
MQYNNSPQLSVLLPFHNETDWLSEAVESILNQTFRDFDLILIDSKATAAAAAVACDLNLRDERIRIVEANAPGIALALNTGLIHSKSDWIARMDADDWSNPMRLQKQLEYLHQHPEIGLIACQTSVHPDCETGQGMLSFMNWQNGIIDQDSHFCNRFIESPIAHPTVVFRRSLIESYGPYSELEIPEDYELWLRWMNNGVHFYKLREPLLCWRDHAQRLTRTAKACRSDRFFKVKLDYLSPFLTEIQQHRSLYICGANRHIRKKSLLLEESGVRITGYTDVVKRNAGEKAFLPANQIHAGDGRFYISLVSSRGKGEEIRSFLIEKGLEEIRDFILAAG